MRTSESEALELLLNRYRLAHGEYMARRRGLNLLLGLGMVSGPVWVVMLLTELYWHWLDGPNPVLYLIFLAVCYLVAVGWTWVRIQTSRRQIRVAKKDVNFVGYNVICDRTRGWYDARLVLSSDTASAEDMTCFAPWREIDFREYDRLFRA